ncbi:MAG: TAXI family TRAP transporter solute-binding subunit [Synergistaceae bacterium]|jgi:TRAP transporter TAXI family solute receptor|nr:TAXI family TRAP transporter solute-binding subunit [Synergistaceae bacterium]
MKKGVAIFCVLALAVLLAMGYRREQDLRPQVRIRMATGGESGIYYAYGDALAEILEKNMNVSVTAIPSGGSADNIRLLRNGRADIAFVQNDIMTYAYNGTNIFSAEGAFKELSVIAGLYPEVCQIAARRDITGVADLKGRRVSVGAEGSGTELNAMQILESYGMDYTDVDVDHLGFSASVEAFREGRIDAFFCTAGVPTPAISELTGEGGAHILSIGDARIRVLTDQYQFYSPYVIPAGTYAGIGADIQTAAVKAALAASDRIDEETVLKIIEIIFGSRDEIARIIPEGKNLSRGYAIDGMPVPLHPASEKFFLRSR